MRREPRSRRTVRGCVVVCLAGLVVAGATTAAPGSSTVAPATFTVDFSQRVRGLSSLVGFTHGLSADAPPDDVVAPLRPALIRGGTAPRERASGLGATYMVVLGDFWGYAFEDWDGRGPPYADWVRWEGFVRDLARRFGSEGVAYELWGEPDTANSFTGTEDQLFEMFRRPHDVVRAELGASATIAGPALVRYNPDLLGRFVDYARATGMKVDALTWHEFGARNVPGVEAHLREARARWVDDPAYDGVGIGRLWITEIVGKAVQYAPGDVAGALYYLERGRAGGATRACWDDSRGRSNCFNDTLDGILTPDSFQPRAPWWVYRAYASGFRHRVEASTREPAIVALASANRRADHATVLIGSLDWLGTNATRDVVVRLDGLDVVLGGDSTVRVRVERIPDAGEAAVTELPEIEDDDRKVSRGRLTVRIRDVHVHEAYLVTLRRA